MFTTRQLKIIAYLLSSNGWIKGRELAEELGISDRTLQTEIKQINLGIPQKAAIHSNNRLGYRLEDKDNFFYSKIQERPKNDLELEESFIRATQILLVMLFEKDFIKIAEIADRLYLSKSSVNSNLGLIKRIVDRTSNAHFLMSSSKGIKIEALENLKRIMIMKCMEKDYGAITLDHIAIIKQIYQYQALLETTLHTVFIEQRMILTGEAYDDFICYLSICIARSQSGMHDDEILEQMPPLLPITSKIAMHVQKTLGYTFTQIEQYQIDKRIREINLLEGPIEKHVSTLTCIQRFQEEVYMQTGFWLMFSYESKQMLAKHIDRMRLRMQSGRNNRGYNTNELSRQFPLEMHLLKTCLSPILGQEISKGELGYLIYYLAAAINSSAQKWSLLLVSDEGAGSVQYIKEKLLLKLQDKIKTMTCIPSYMFLDNEAVYLQTHQLFITTNQSLTLKYNFFILIGKTIAPYQLDSMFHKVREAIERYEQTKINQMKAYLCEDQTVNEKLVFSNILTCIQTVLKDAKISLESIGNTMLCIICHSSHPSFIQRLYLKHPMNYKRKPIVKLLIVNYGKDEHLLPYFSYVQQIVEKM